MYDRLALHGLSPRHLLALFHGVHGGADDDPDARELLARAESIADMSDDELEAFQTALRESAESVAEETTDENIALLGEIADALETIAGEVDARAEAAAEREARRDEALARIRGEAEGDPGDGEGEGDAEGAEGDAAEGEGDGDAEGAEGDGDAEGAEGEPAEVGAPAAVEGAAPAAAAEGDAAPAEEGDGEPAEGEAAPARRTPALGAMSRRRPAAHAPRRTEPAHSGPRIRVAGNVPMHSAGDEVDLDQAAFALSEKARLTQGVMGKFPVLSFQAEYPEDRILNRSMSSDQIKAVLDAVVSPQALVASGGLCAPLEPYYGLAMVSDNTRVVPRALPSFQAPRGGLTWVEPPRLSEILVNTAGQTTAGRAITIHDHDDDVAARTKTVQRVMCGDQASARLHAISDQLEFGNFQSRSWPEGDRAFVDLSLAQWAATADTRLLQLIAAGSTVANTAQVFGATRDLLGAMARGYARYVARHRMRQGTVLRALMPRWVVSLVLADMANAGTAPGWDAAEAWFIARARERGFAVTLFWDGEDTTQRLLDAQGIGGLLDFPNTMIWYFFHEGAWVHLDGGTLDLGVVRDGDLVASNDFRTFFESFETVAFLGVESIKVTSQVCPDGSGMGNFAPEDLTLCSGASFGS